MNYMNEEDLNSDEQEFGIWLENGIERGWISGPFCVTHDGGIEYMSEEEVQEWEDGGDPCQHVVRIML